jgi:DNA repair exonuclease SbcCD ATPase subunit
MHELVRLSFHNWYVFEATEVDVAGMIAVIGPTGAGKSAILDGIQVAMTGDNHNFIDLNPSAGERSDRTVLSYCLGQITDFERGEPRRNRSETIVTLTFRHKQSGAPTTIGVLMEADRSERVESVRARFVARGYAFSFADFLQRDPDGDEFIVGHAELIERLKKKCGKQVTFHSSATHYVAEFLTAMRPRSAPEPRLFLRSFNNAVLAREIKDPTDFVRRFVLEAEPLNVERVRSSISTWRSLEKRAQALEAELRAIHAVRGRFAVWARDALQAQTDEYISAAAGRMHIEMEIEELKKQKESAEQESQRLMRLISNHSAVVHENRNDILRKRTMLTQSSEAAKLRAIEVEERETENARNRAEERFAATLQGLNQITQFSAMRAFVPIRYHGAIDAARELAAAQESANRLAEKIDQLAGMTRRALAILGAREALVAQRDARVEEIATARSTVRNLEQSLRAAGDGRGMLSAPVRQFMDDLAMRGIQSLALPDVVEISDPSWAPALEMLLGANREAVIVPDPQVEQAFDYLWQNRSRWHGCRIVNTRKSRRDQGWLPADSIAHVVRTLNPDARAFIDSHVGRYVCAQSENDLQSNEHAVMRNGKTSAGLALRVHRDLNPILGKTAQAAAIKAAHERLAALNAEIREKDHERKLLDGGLAHLTMLAAAGDVEAQLRAAADDIRRADARLSALARDLAGVEDRQSRTLRTEIDEYERQTRAYEEEISELWKAEREASLLADRANNRITERQEAIAAAQLTEHRLEREQAREAKLVAFANAEELTIAKAKARLAVEAFQKRGEEKRYLAERRDRAKESAETLRRAAKDNGLRALRDFADYVRQWLEGPSPLPDQADHADHCFWCAARESRLQEHELRPHRDKVIEARREFEAALKEDLLAKLSDRLEKVATQLDVLNRRLAGYVFVGQRYCFKRSVSPDFKPLYDLVQRVVGKQNASLAALMSDGDEKIRRALAQIEDIVTREQDTKRLEDYRNYFEFELYLENRAGEQQPFSKLVGLLSGGQRQAPYYVAIAASMVSVYFPRGPGEDEGMGLVAFDEAFNKLDIGNTQNLIALYRDLGLQLVIAAPEVHRATFLESVDCIVSVTRVHNTDEVIVDSERIGPRARAEMAEANPAHRGIEWFRKAIEEMPQRAAE